MPDPAIGHFFWPVLAPSRASPLPQGYVWNTDFVYTKETCGSGLARDGAGAFTVKSSGTKKPPDNGIVRGLLLVAATYYFFKP